MRKLDLEIVKDNLSEDNEDNKEELLLWDGNDSREEKLETLTNELEEIHRA